MARCLTLREQIFSTAALLVGLVCLIAAAVLLIHGILALLFGWPGWVALLLRTRFVFYDFVGSALLFIGGILLLRLGARLATPPSGILPPSPY